MIYNNVIYSIDSDSIHSAVDECFKHKRYSVLVVVCDSKAFKETVSEIVKYTVESHDSTAFKYAETLGFFSFVNGSYIRIMHEPISSRGIRVNRILADERVSIHTLYTVLMPCLKSVNNIYEEELQ